MNGRNTIVTPFVTIKVTNDGREINIKIHEDIRKGAHTAGVYAYFEKLKQRGIKDINADHIRVQGLNRGINLSIHGKKPDIIYRVNKELVIVEIKTKKSLGKDDTRKQLEHWIKWGYRPVLSIPEDCIFEARQIVSVLGMEKKVNIDYY